MERKHGEPPWWWPDTKAWIVMGLFALTAGILWWTRPPPGVEPSEFFKAISQAVVLTGFLVAVGSFFQSSQAAERATAATTAQSGRLVDALVAAGPTQTPIVVSAPATVEVTPGAAESNPSPDAPKT